MTLDETQKPEFEEWLYWASVIIDRLTNAIHIYSRPAREDIFMPGQARQHRNGHTIALQTRIIALIDETDMPTDSLTELEHHSERVIDGLALLFKETLDHLPGLSLDMQKLAKSPWHTKSGDRIIDEMFHGPMGNEREGIGSGYPEHGRLPQVLSSMLLNEQTGENRSPSAEVLSSPTRADKNSERWTASNSHLLRAAGRID